MIYTSTFFNLELPNLIFICIPFDGTQIRILKEVAIEELSYKIFRKKRKKKKSKASINFHRCSCTYIIVCRAFSSVDKKGLILIDDNDDDDAKDPGVGSFKTIHENEPRRRLT